MYEILIIDDEENIINGLARTLEQREDLELQIHTASTVAEGQRIVRETKLDILCSDISMPVMDGFEFGRWVKSIWKDCRIIFLTGYDNFDYIYTALNQFNGRYLLKNDAADKLVDLIRECIREIQFEWKAREDRIRLTRMEDEQNRYRRERILREFLDSRQAGPELERARRMLSEVGLDADRGMYMLFGELLDTGDIPEEGTPEESALEEPVPEKAAAEEESGGAGGTAEKNVCRIADKIAQDYEKFFCMRVFRITGRQYLFLLNANGGGH